MAKVLVIAEHLGGQLNAATAKTVSAAQALQAESIDIVVLAADPAAVAAQAAQIAGVARVLTVANPANEHAVAQVLGPQIAKLASSYSHVFGPSTTFGKDLMPVVAALLGVNQVSDLMAVEGSNTFQRPIYAGNAIITVEAPADQIVVATVRTASCAEAAKGGNAQIEAVRLRRRYPAHTRFVGSRALASPTVPTCRRAKRVVSGGRGVGSAENFEVIYELADKLGAGGGRLARRGGRGLRAERLAGRPDRQDHRAGAVHGRRHLAARSSTWPASRTPSTIVAINKDAGGPDL